MSEEQKRKIRESALRRHAQARKAKSHGTNAKPKTLNRPKPRTRPQQQEDGMEAEA